MQVHVEPSMEKLHLSSDLKSLTKVRANPCSNFFNLAVSDSALEPYCQYLSDATDLIFLGFSTIFGIQVLFSVQSDSSKFLKL